MLVGRMEQGPPAARRVAHTQEGAFSVLDESTPSSTERCAQWGHYRTGLIRRSGLNGTLGHNRSPTGHTLQAGECAAFKNPYSSIYNVGIQS